ncbi:MAG: S9 family peptidase [Bacteroidia bacterium]|nr:S9 family peptidase [Bacteroidia bacterium]
MKRLLLTLSCACLALISLHAQVRESGNLVLRNVPELPAALRDRVGQYQSIRGASALDWAPGGGLLISTRFGEVAQVHHVAAPGAYRRQLTFSAEPTSGARVCPDPAQQQFLYARDIGGNENFQLYAFDLRSGASRLLTDGSSRNQGGRWSTDGTRIAYTSNKRSAADLDVYIASPGQPASEARRVYQGQGGGWSISDWSDDQQRMILEQYRSVTDSRLFLLETATGALTPLFPREQSVAYGGARFSADGSGLFFISDENSEFARLRYADLATGAVQVITSGIEWDVEGFSMSRDRRKLYFSTNENGFSRLYRLDLKTLRYAAVPGIPEGTFGSGIFSPDGRQLALTLNTSRTASDAYTLDTKTGRLTRWTFSETGGLNPDQFVTPSLIEYPTFDEVNGAPRKIPALLYQPAGASGRLPSLILIHGGPEGQSRPSFSSFVQMLVQELGIAVLVPNVRGSTGYGKTYVSLDNGPLRENSVRDIGALLDWIAAQPGLDPERVAVYGGSYGGYMSLACMTHYNARLRCGVDLFGISNFTTFLKNTSSYRQDLRRAEYGDERDPAMAAVFERISPISSIRNITKPMMVFQGKNDPRVPLSESDQMVEALLSQGNEVWYLMAKDEGHGIARKSNREQVDAALLLFLKRYLL